MPHHSTPIRFALLLRLCTTLFATGIHAADKEQTDSYIIADGIVDPSDAPISTVDYVTYAFTGDIINKSVVIERSGITVDGGWHKLVTRF